ncbi:DAN domain family member 5-like [Hyperolius riggenbachi]|uniref:DAN domain family member 5-like n=1 Tax=Hyperolius riggenbachi TaxID=752182 RepID=UPI0035A3883D
MLFLQLALLIFPTMVVSAPFDDEEGSTFIWLNTQNRRPHTGPPFGASPKVSPHAILNSPFNNRGSRDSPKPFFQKMLSKMPNDLVDGGAVQRKRVWENAIEKTKSHPDQVLPLEEDALKRSRCNAMPFIQNIFRKNCAPLRIPNKFCFGQCNSFYIPGWPNALPQPCTSCAPSISRRVFLPLQCRGDQVSWEEVVLVEECTCETRYDRDTGRRSIGDIFPPIS